MQWEFVAESMHNNAAKLLPGPEVVCYLARYLDKKK